MSIRTPTTLTFASLFFLLPGLCRRAQAQTAPSPPSTETASAPAPVDTMPASHTEKKVWTNDDMANLHGQPTVSTVGQKAPNSKASSRSSHANDAKNRVAWYQSQIAKLQAQLAPIQGQIADLQAALSGSAVSTPRKYSGVHLDDWQAQLVQLQKRREDILSQIATLEDQARHDGVPGSSLP